MPKLMGSLERVYQRKEPSSVQLIVTMMPGAKTVPKGSKSQKYCNLEPKLKTHSQVSRSLVV